MLRVEELSFGYDRDILKGITFDLSEGKFVSLLGINGAGKSTLLKNLNKLLKPKGGSIYIDGENLSALKNKELARRMSYVGQYNMPNSNTVYDTILVGRIPHFKDNPREQDHEIVEEIIDQLGLRDYALRDSATLSGGEFQKVVLARALAQEPRVILLDEPTSNLDIKNQISVMDLVKAYCLKKEIAVLISIHDINLALQFSDKFLFLKDGSIFQYGDVGVVTPENIREIYDIDVDIIEYKGRKVVVNQ